MAAFQNFDFDGGATVFDRAQEEVVVVLPAIDALVSDSLSLRRVFERYPHDVLISRNYGPAKLEPFHRTEHISFIIISLHFQLCSVSSGDLPKPRKDFNSVNALHFDRAC